MQLTALAPILHSNDIDKANVIKLLQADEKLAEALVIYHAGSWAATYRSLDLLNKAVAICQYVQSLGLCGSYYHHFIAGPATFIQLKGSLILETDPLPFTMGTPYGKLLISGTRHSLPEERREHRKRFEAVKEELGLQLIREDVRAATALWHITKWHGETLEASHEIREPQVGSCDPEKSIPNEIIEQVWEIYKSRMIF